MAELADILAYARDGWNLFPIKPGQKKPPLVADWEHASSRDPSTIEAWHAQHPGCNWGVATGPSGLLVVDVDVKKSKAGRTSLFDLELENATLPDTLRVSTPTGGEHIYLRGRASSTVEKLGQGLDTRSAGGYVLAPGSVIDGVPYGVIQAGRIADAPAWLVSAVGAPIERKEATAPIIETEGRFAQAAAWLRTAEPAVEGAGGNAHTFKVAARLRDYGIAEHTALSLLLAGWNDRCTPPWAEDELTRIVGNAYTYAKKEAGAAAAESAFAGIPVADATAPASIFEDGPAKVAQPELRVKLASEIDPAAIKPRAWILGHRFLKNYITLTIAPGGVGKSTLAIFEALCVAAGNPEPLGLKHAEQGPVWLYNTEDPMDEIERRVLACAQCHHFGRSTLERVHLSSGREKPLILVRDNGKGPEMMEGNIKACIEYINKHGIKLFCVDPFVRAHQVDENDNMAIDRVAQAFTRIAAETGAAIHLVHHTRKRSNGAGGEGDMDSARGASSLVSAARVAHTLCGMSEKEGDKRGLPKGQFRFWVRLDDAKANLAPPQDKETWFRKYGEEIVGEKVGVLKLETPLEVTREDEEKPKKRKKDDESMI